MAEIEPFPCKVLAHHYPDVPNLGSVTEITKEQIESLGHIDLVVGGFPCQDLSIAGKRKGLQNEDGSATRSGLFFTAMRIIEWAKPRWVVVENVPGLYSSQKGRDFASVVGEMAGCEFDVPRDGWKNAGCAVGENGLVEWITLDAQYCRTPEYPRAVPQRRRRVFVVRDSGDWQSRKPLFLEPEGLCGNPPPSRKTREEVAGTVAGSLDSECGGGKLTHQSIMNGHIIKTSSEISPPLETQVGGLRQPCTQAYVTTMPAIPASLHKGLGHNKDEFLTIALTGNMDAIPDVARTLSFRYDSSYCADRGMDVIALAGNTIGREPENGGNGTGFDESGASYTLTKTDVHAVAYPINTQIAMRHEKTGEGTGMGIGIDGDPAYTLQAAHSHAVAFHVDAQPDEMNFSTVTTSTLTKSQHAGVMQPNMQVRRLTPIECARLQAFPDNFLSQVKGYSDSAAYKSLGNSMACNVMAVIGQKIQQASQLSEK